MRTIRVFAAVDRRQSNFGDNLMGPILREIFGLDPVFVLPDQAELIGVGSILDYFTRHQVPSLSQRTIDFLRAKRKSIGRPDMLHVWGSGFISGDGLARWPYPMSIHAVRGPLTRAKVGIDDVAMGDPALLLPRFWPRSISRIAVAIVPHWRSRDIFLRRYINEIPKHWHMVDALGDPREIAETISSAEFVVSSSLHGLIVADAYGVPNCWIEAETQLTGGDFKFRDYAGFRGRELHGQFSFARVLKDHKTLAASELSAAAPIGEDAVARLLAAFPYK